MNRMYPLTNVSVEIPLKIFEQGLKCVLALKRIGMYLNLVVDISKLQNLLFYEILNPPLQLRFSSAQSGVN